MKNFLRSIKETAALAYAYAVFRATKSAPSALELLSKLKPKNWQFEARHQRLSPFVPDFKLETVIDAVKERKLLVSFSAGSGESYRAYRVKSNLKNDGSDEIYIKRVHSNEYIPMSAAALDFDIIGVKDTVIQVELYYTDENNVSQYDRLFVEPFKN